MIPLALVPYSAACTAEYPGTHFLMGSGKLLPPDYWMIPGWFWQPEGPKPLSITAPLKARGLSCVPWFQIPSLPFGGFSLYWLPLGDIPGPVGWITHMPSLQSTVTLQMEASQMKLHENKPTENRLRF